MTCNVKIQFLRHDATMPEQMHEHDAGYDLYATSVEETPHYIEYGTGLALAIPTGWVGLLFPRSSVSKKDLALANSVGVVDSGYRGEVRLRFKHALTPPEQEGFKIYQVGERVGQLVLMQVPKVQFQMVDTLVESSRGLGGFGSTNLLSHV